MTKSIGVLAVLALASPWVAAAQTQSVEAQIAEAVKILPEDLRAVFPETMAHRIFLEPVYEMRRERIVPVLCRAVLDTVPAP